jgi:hypothetical protein
MNEIKNMILRQETESGLTTKASELTFAELDDNFIALYRQYKEDYAAIIADVPAWNSGTTYTPSSEPIYVKYNDIAYELIKASPSLNEEPDTVTTSWTVIGWGLWLQKVVADLEAHDANSPYEYGSGTNAIQPKEGNNDASGQESNIGGGFLNSSSGLYSVVAGGTENEAIADESCILGGIGNQTNGKLSTIIGGLRAITTRYAECAYASNVFSIQGDAQRIDLLARNVTTNDTPTELALDGASERITIREDTVMAGTINISAIQSTGAKSAHYIRKFAIKNIGGTTALVGSVSTVGTDVEDDSDWDIALTADNTNDALAVTVTGKTGETIRWLAHIEANEIGI